MKPRTLIVVGAGIGGLSTGCHAQMSGYRVRIFEMHSTPGGLCTSWKRNGYVFDGCIHNLAGWSEHSPFHRIFQDLGGAMSHERYANATGARLRHLQASSAARGGHDVFLRFIAGGARARALAPAPLPAPPC
jgi:phytoene dehydrogenase-like protein